jgi:hypothetical protein
MWEAKTKADLVIEVWEKLDCESVGAAEIEAIETVLAGKYGQAAILSPMAVARMLADEGAELRHSEVMSLWVRRNAETAVNAAFRNILQLSGLRPALRTIRELENLRRKYVRENDKEGLRSVRETALRGKRRVNEIAGKSSTDGVTRLVNIEISQWLSVWLQTPEFFDGWVELRQRSADFVERFGQIGDD